MDKYLSNLIPVQGELTHLFNQIYGEPEYYNFKENASLSDYKKQFKKLLKTLENGFNNSEIQTDNFHKSQIYKLIDDGIKSIGKAKTIEDLYVSLICFYTDFTFLLLGMIPVNSSHSRKITNSHRWELNKFRQIKYYQTREQKFKQLENLIKNEKIEEFPNPKEIYSLYQKERQKKEDILDWFKRTKPDLYIKFFDYQ